LVFHIVLRYIVNLEVVTTIGYCTLLTQHVVHLSGTWRTA